MRAPFTWLVVAVGILLVIVATAAIGNRDKSDETVTAGEWAQTVCGSVAVWRGELEAIVEDVRTPNANSTAGEEPQSETPQGRTGFIRKGLERTVQATETMVEGIDNAGVPETAQGEEAADYMSVWAERALGDLEETQESLDEEADSLEESIEQLRRAMGVIGGVLVSGVQTITDVAELDPALAVALSNASTCEQLREETS